jgi:PAS domain S-box-containing protein
MTGKPTYEELERRVQELETRLAECRPAGDETAHVLRRLHAAVDAAGIGVWELDLCDDRLVWDERMFAMHGAPSNSFGADSKTWKYGIHPEDLERTESEVQAAVAGEKEFHTRFRIVHSDGKVRHIEAHAVVLRDPDGKPLRMVGANIDVTEARRAVEALERSEERLRLFIEHTPAAVAVCDRQMRYLAYSRRWIKDYHLPEENLIGRSHYEVFQSIPERWKAEHQRCFAGEIIENEEEPFPRADGTREWVRRKVYPWRDAAGAIRGLIMFTEVVTERVLAQAALRESEAKYRKLVENATDAIFIAQDEAIKFPNRKTLELLELAAEDLMGVSFAKFIHPEDRSRVLDTHRRRLAGQKGLPTTYSFRVLSRGGREYTVELNAVQIEWEGRPATLNFVRDLTEQKKMEASLKQAQKMEAIGTLAGGIAHDFNNILMGIQGRVSLLLADSHPADPGYDHLKGVEEYIRSAADLTKQLLGFARGGKYQVRPIDLNDLMTKTATLFGRTKKEIKIHFKLQQNPWVVEADRGQFEQVLLNIFVNAWQAMPGGGDLYLQTENTVLDEKYAKPFQVEHGRYFKISITDTGIGMDTATLEKVFDPFFTTKEMGRGTGLGLASVYGIVKNHNGLINVYSEKGKGTTFNIYLPATQKAVGQGAEPALKLRTGTETVLLVDDEKMITDVGKSMLERLGYTVYVAGGGEEALECYRSHAGAIHLVILDMIMPEMNGGETFDRMREIDPKVRVLLSSGYSINGDASEILDRGCNGFIQKPFNLIKLSYKVREILDG